MPFTHSLENDLSSKGWTSTHLAIRDSEEQVVARLPLWSHQTAAGPTVLVTAGLHGDEFEGPRAVLRLFEDLEGRELPGNLLLLPYANPPALAARTRRSPSDGADLNRSFPGRADVGLTAAIARAISTELLARAEVVLDLHAGGHPHHLVPSVMLHFIEDEALFEKTRETLTKLGTPVLVLIEELETAGLLDTVSIEAGRIFGCVELGGGGDLDPLVGEVARGCLANLLRTTGFLPGRVEPQSWRNLFGPVLLAVEGTAPYRKAPIAGFYEPLLQAGDPIEEGMAIGRMSTFADAEVTRTVIQAERDGLLYLQHAGGMVASGDLLAVEADVLADQDELRGRWRSRIACRQR